MPLHSIEINLDRRYIDGGPYSRLKVYPIKLIAPIFMDPCPQYFREISAFVGEIDLAEYITGSTAFYKSSFSPERTLQLSTIIPSLISKDSLDLFTSPHRLIKNAGFVGIYIPVSRNIVKEFINTIKEALKLIKLDEVMHKDNEECTFLCKFLDPKMILKIMVQNYFPGIAFKIMESYSKLSIKPRLFKAIPFIRFTEYNYCLLYTSPSPRDRG